MSARAVGLLGLACVWAAAACSSQPQRPARAGSGGAAAAAGTGGGGAASGGSSGSAGAGGSGATAGQGGAAGSGGSSTQCGDGVIEFGEQCDGSNFGGQSCQSLGFTSGSLTCKNCTIDESGCRGTENCTDGIDNDGDRLVDCADPNCTAACADSCAHAVSVSDPVNLIGSTLGHATIGLPSCARSGSQAAPAVVYKLTAANSGVLDILLNSAQDLLVTVRTTCSDASTETFCGGQTQASIPIQQGNTVYVAVTGANTGVTGSYSLALRTRVPKCGDGVLDSGEQCDDGNTVSGDGCSANCTIESSETEPNNTVAQANSYVDPFFAQISPAGDVDVVKVVVPSASGGSTLSAETFDYGDGACYKDLLDSAIDIIGPDGTSVVASDDDSGIGLCAHAVASNLAGGTYYVRVTASQFGNTPTFPYVLRVTVQ